MEFNEKQVHILNIAEKLFACKGFDGTSIRDIAEAAGVNIAMISYYFGSKEKLFEALFEFRTSHLSQTLGDLLQRENLSPFEKISIVIDEYLSRVAEKQTFYKIMVFEQALEKNTVITQLLNDLKKQNTELLERIIKEGQKNKVFKKDVDVVLLLNTLNGVSTNAFISKDYYRQYHGLQHLPEEVFLKTLQVRLSKHLKVLFKALLGYEA